MSAWLVWTKTQICNNWLLHFFCLCLSCQLFMVVQIAFERHFCLAWGSTVSTMYAYICIVWAQLHCQIAITVVCCTSSTSVPHNLSKHIVRLSTFTKSRILQPSDFKHQERCSGMSCLKQPLNNGEALNTMRMELNSNKYLVLIQSLLIPHLLSSTSIAANHWPAQDCNHACASVCLRRDMTPNGRTELS